MDASPAVEGDRGGEAGLSIHVVLVLVNLFFFVILYIQTEYHSRTSLLSSWSLCEAGVMEKPFPLLLASSILGAGANALLPTPGFQPCALRPGSNAQKLALLKNLFLAFFSFPERPQGFAAS